MSQNDHHLRDAINFDYVSPPSRPPLIDQHDHHYMYRNYGFYLLKHFVVALTNAFLVKLAQLH